VQPIRLLRRLGVLTLPIIGIAGATGAWAADTGTAAFGPGYSADAPLGAPTELQIDLRGEVPARCRMTSPPALGGHLDFNRSGDAQSKFGLDCNAPFELSVRSGGGGFVATGSAEGAGVLLPYEVAVSVDTDTGTDALGWCRANQLTDAAEGQCAFGGKGWSSGDATAIDRTGTLKLRWSAPADGGVPPAGDYRDTIAINVAVRA
jgi:hypothetical protein